MRYLLLAMDYDGTIAHDGTVARPTIEALVRLRSSGRRLVLVTGRELDDLAAVFGRLDLFDRIVAENGGVLFDPLSRSSRTLAPPADPAFVAALRRRGVAPLAVGRVVVATREPHQAAVLEAIHELGLELYVVFNKGSVMVLPAGITKATGLGAALDDLRISPHDVVGVGDAENDQAFLAMCEVAVAVANALPGLKERSDLVTAGANGSGVTELVDRILADDLRSLEPALSRHDLLISEGTVTGDEPSSPDLDRNPRADGQPRRSATRTEGAQSG